MAHNHGGDVESPDPSALVLRAVGERIEVLLEASSAHGAIARQRSEEMLRLITDLYGAGLERLLEILYDAGRLDPDVLADLADDDLVASLLLVHGLHPYDLETRVERALQGVRPALAAAGAQVEVAEIGVDGVVGLRVSGTFSGCTATSVTQIVQDAVGALTPDAAAG